MGSIDISDVQAQAQAGKAYKNKFITAVRKPFHVITTTLLSLLLPLSFLLLARLATAHYLHVVAGDYPTLPLSHSFLSTLFFVTKNLTLVHVLVSLTSVSCLTHSLTLTLYPNSPVTRHHLYVAWALLTLLQLSVGFGIEGSIAAGVDGSAFGQDRSMISRAMFFLGMHETILFWMRTVVRPVVDDTIYGYSRREGWVEKVAVGLSYGGLWWWRLREEVEALVLVPEVKKELMMGIGLTDFVGWWLYYVTVTIGMVRVIKGLVLAILVLKRRTWRAGGGENRLNDEKV